MRITSKDQEIQITQFGIFVNSQWHFIHLVQKRQYYRNHRLTRKF
ncbi:unnamed protein product [Paramecium primaurelia]|uniref:Uncharacterized protein n=1 Tax=Paramecium primaurelia TaxID=5886 RepID=A0A8S1M9X5_PARPR|nr:unnamed protein product [Paramecium primaurelia]